MEILWPGALYITKGPEGLYGDTVFFEFQEISLVESPEKLLELAKSLLGLYAEITECD